MKVNGSPCRTIRPLGQEAVEIIDQTRLPHAFETRRLVCLEDVARAIAEMQVRGAPLIGAAASYGVALAMRDDNTDGALLAACERLAATRPTAVNLHWALSRMRARLAPLPQSARAAAAWTEAAAICDEDVAANRALGGHGIRLIRESFERKHDTVNVLTHCNAGWLATVDWGTALAPVYTAHDAGIPLHVWVSETRPRNQGALTAWELANHGVPHTFVADNACGHLMRRGHVDLVIVGADRVTRNGDVANKVGTYLKALAARDAGVPFHVAMPGSTVDWELTDGSAIPIEERDPDEVSHVAGVGPEGKVTRVRVCPPASPVANPAFDVTPARLVTAFITDRGVTPATPQGLAALFTVQAA